MVSFRPYCTTGFPYCFRSVGWKSIKRRITKTRASRCRKDARLGSYPVLKHAVLAPDVRRTARQTISSGTSVNQRTRRTRCHIMVCSPLRITPRYKHLHFARPTGFRHEEYCSPHLFDRSNDLAAASSPVRLLYQCKQQSLWSGGFVLPVCCAWAS
jgi:hypothetical protein